MCWSSPWEWLDALHLDGQIVSASGRSKSHSPSVSDVEGLYIGVVLAGDHLSWTAERARAAEYRPDTPQMVAFANASESYRRVRSRLEALWTGQDR